MAGKKRQDKVAKKRNERKKTVKDNSRKKRREELERARLQQLPAEVWVKANGEDLADAIEEILQEAEESPDQGTTPADAGPTAAVAAGAADPAAELLARGRAWAANTLAVEGDGAVVMCNDLLALARTGCWEAMELLCTLCRNKRPGIIPEELGLRIAEQLLKYGQQEHVGAIALIGELFADGVLFEHDPEEAADFLQEAWAVGSVQAGNRLAQIYLDDKSALGVSEGIPILLINAQSGNVEAMELLGKYLLDKAYSVDLHSLGTSLLYLAARRGRPGTFLRSTLHGCVNSGFMDPLRPALEDPALDGPIQWCLRGLARLAGLGYSPSVEEGLALLERSAEAGFAPACGHLAGIHLCGLWGVEPDREKADVWIARGIGLDNPRCLALEPLIPLLSPAGCREPIHWDERRIESLFWAAPKGQDALTGISAFLYMALEPGPQDEEQYSLLDDPDTFVAGISTLFDIAEMQLDPLPFFLVAGMLDVLGEDGLGGDVEGEETNIAFELCDTLFHTHFCEFDECIHALNRFGAILATPNSLDRLVILDQKASLLV